MHKVIGKLLPLYLLLPLSYTSQVVFCAPGAVWTGLQATSFWYPGASNQTRIVYTGDTIFDADTVKKLKHLLFYDECNSFHEITTYIKQKGDTILMKSNKTFEKWEVLYNFAAKAGDSWNTTFATQSSGAVTFKTIVDSVKSVTENGLTLRQLHVRTLYPNTFIPTRQITERYGLGFLFAFHYRGCNDGDRFLGPLCYTDKQFGTKYFGTLPCDYENPVGLPVNGQGIGPYRAYPSPVSSKLKVENITATVRLLVVDILGNSLIETGLIDDHGGYSYELDLASLPAGTIICSFTTNKTIVLSERSSKSDLKGSLYCLNAHPKSA
jgi:hypothetical protein